MQSFLRRAKRYTKDRSNLVGQKIVFTNKEGELEQRTIWHKKESNLPRLYPNMDKIGVKK